MRISLLGSGWLGFPLAKLLIEEGHAVSISTRTEAKIPKIQAIGGKGFVIDLADPAPLPPEFCEADVLIISITSKSIDEHLRIARLIPQSPIQQIIYTSSTSVYPSHAGLVDEQTAPIDDHPLRQIESLYQELPQACCILRLAGLVGPDRHPGRFFRKRPEAGLARVPSNLVHLHDLLPVFTWLLTAGPVNELYNIASDEHPPKFDFYSKAYQEFFQEQAAFRLISLRQSRNNKTVANTKIKEASGLRFQLARYYSFAVG